MLHKILIASSLLFSPLAAATCDAAPVSFVPVGEKAIPAVVFIRVEMSADSDDMFNNQNPFGPQGGQPGSPDDFFNKFFGFPGGRPQQPQPQVGQGSGFFVSADGYIMTNAHVVRGADKIEVTLNDGQVLEATMIGNDPQTDVAVIKVEGKDFPFLTFGDSDKIKVGEPVAAIGSPFQLQASLTTGVISAKGRQGLKISDLEDFIQTDAAINPGNSGGPLLNLNSEVIGINTAIVSRSGGYMGIGFAIPSNLAKQVMGQLIDKGAVTRAFLGVSLQPVDKDIAAGFNLEKAEGALISDIVPDSPADKAGLKQGDIILEYNGKVIKSLQTFRNDIALMNPGTQINLKVYRKGQNLNISVTLAASAESASAPAVSAKLGIDVDNLTPDMSKQLGYNKGEEGVVIVKVKPGSPAAMAGLRPGFLIVAVNHKKVANTGDFNGALAESSKNKRILLLVRQGTMTRFYSIRID
ncbi:MAG: DegQ family serine endoprotease [Verrucomicrobia bacterium]|nr:DegQ family serine endoprotease [Verrucomicrobiota bacterium]